MTSRSSKTTWTRTNDPDAVRRSAREALEEVLDDLPEDLSGIVLVTATPQDSEGVEFTQQAIVTGSTAVPMARALNKMAHSLVQTAVDGPHETH